VAVAAAAPAAEGRGVAADLVLGIALGDERRRGPWSGGERLGVHLRRPWRPIKYWAVYETLDYAFYELYQPSSPIQIFQSYP
jgi:hypothetical protein